MQIRPTDCHAPDRNDRAPRSPRVAGPAAGRFRDDQRVTTLVDEGVGFHICSARNFLSVCR